MSAACDAALANASGVNAVKVQAPMDARTLELAKRAHDLKVEELIARVRGDANKVAEIRAQSAEVAAEWESQAANAVLSLRSVIGAMLSICAASLEE